MKRSIEGYNQFNIVDEEEANTKLKQQNLLNEFLVLQKEFVSRKRKLQATKQRRENIFGEILFLKLRHRYLLKSQASNVDSERNVSHKKFFDTESEVPEEEGFDSGYDAALGTACLASTPKLNLRYEVGGKEVVAGRYMLRSEFVPKNYLIDGSWNWKEETLLQEKLF